MDQPVAELIKFARRRKSMYFIEWQRLPADGIFIVLCVVFLVIAALITYFEMLRRPTKMPTFHLIFPTKRLEERDYV
jgi:hypothetical protein